MRPVSARAALAALATLLACTTFAGCALAPPAPLPVDLLQDTRFEPPSQRITAADAMSVSEPMRDFLRSDIAVQLRQQGLQRGLVQALYQRGQLRLEYEATMTRNAAQAFEARSGNCLSLVLMTAALARELGLTVHFQSAFVDESWSRRGELYFRSGHVNITLGRRFMDVDTSRLSTAYTVDFLPPDQIAGMRTREIDEATVVAMYLNNRAAESLVHGPQQDAYWWAREAIRHQPGFLAAYNTLGVIYLRRGDAAAAERAFAHVLRHAPDNTQALFNLSQLLARAGRAAEAAPLAQRLARLEPNPPYHFFDLGREAMDRGDFAAARALFARELAREPYQSEFHYWHALADWRLGDVDQARRHLTLAQEHSTRPGEQALYGAKLDWLRTQQRVQ